MLAKRLVPCLPVDPGPAHEPERLAQDLVARARSLEDDGADEILMIFPGDLEAAKGWPLDALRRVTLEVSVTVLAQGGSTPHDLASLIEAGADKLVVPVSSTGLLEHAVSCWGGQNVVARLDARQAPEAIAQAQQAARDGASELIASGTTSLDGLDTRAIRAVSDAVPLPVIVEGPMSQLQHVRQALLEGRADAVLLPLELIEDAHGMAEVKRYLAAAGIVVRGVS